VRSLARLGGGVLVLSGYVLVAVAQQIEFWSLSNWRITFTSTSLLVFQSAATVAYVAVGVAWFIHLPTVNPRPDQARRVRWTMWIFAGASALLTVAWLAELDDVVYTPITPGAIAGMALTAFGYGVVFAGFFWAGKALGIGEVTTLTPEPYNPGSDPASVPVPYETV
jgi:hypothetical protein